jgi:hypothetical protein
MNITNYNVYDLAESIVASGLPMQAAFDDTNFTDEVSDTLKCFIGDKENKHISRMIKLASTPNGSGHANALSGILVSVNITATVKWWEQFQRYHFKQVVSSMSTMHRLRRMAIEGTLKFDPDTDKSCIDAFVNLAKNPDVTDEQLAYSCPMGLQLTARINTNYLQLKTQYHQRKHHKLSEWHQYCSWIETLPLAKELIVGEGTCAES